MKIKALREMKGIRNGIIDSVAIESAHKDILQSAWNYLDSGG